MFIFADGALFAALGWELINEVRIPVQERGGQRGEGAYFRENTVHTYGCIHTPHTYMHKREKFVEMREKMHPSGAHLAHITLPALEV